MANFENENNTNEEKPMSLEKLHTTKDWLEKKLQAVTDEIEKVKKGQPEKQAENLNEGLKEDKSKEEIIPVRGLHCKSCVDIITSKISKLEGIENIRVSLIENKIYVKYNPYKIRLNKIKSEIDSLGYDTGKYEGKEVIKKENTLMQGIAYGLIPHIGCIAFIIGSILGVTVLMKFFKPLLMNRYFFHILILISLLFATLSSYLYLRKNGLLSWAGIKRKQKYLLTMFGSTIGINLLLFFLIFPLLANFSLTPSVTGAVVGVAGGNSELSLLELKVNIPCSGHAPLISNSLKSISGVADVKFSFPNVFNVKYDPGKTSEQEILSIDVFETYKATVLKSVQQVNQQEPVNTPPANLPSGGGCGGGCGGCGGL